MRFPGRLSVASRALVCSSVMLCAVMVGACDRPESSRPLDTIRVGYSGDTDFGDLPSLVAHARLRDLGYRVEVTHFGAPDLAVEAVSRGSVDVIHGSMISAWTAAARGARVRTVMDHLANPYRLVVAPDIGVCAGLDGRRLALGGESAVSTHLVRAFIREECPTIQPVPLLVMESTNRSAALLAGGVDATVLELSVVLWLEGQAPGRFRVLSDFSARWPLVQTTGVHANTEFSAAHPDVVVDYVRALLEANRDVLADPILLVSNATDDLGASQDWAAVAQAYLTAGVWPQDGGLTHAEVAQTLAFFTASGALPPATSPENVVAPEFLAEALAERAGAR